MTLKIKIGRKHEGKYPWRRMDIGDSFVSDVATQGGLITSAARHGVRIKSRKISDTEVRVWRIA